MNYPLFISADSYGGNGREKDHGRFLLSVDVPDSQLATSRILPNPALSSNARITFFRST